MGVITRGDILRALQPGDIDASTPALNVGSEPPIVTWLKARSPGADS